MSEGYAEAGGKEAVPVPGGGSAAGGVECVAVGVAGEQTAGQPGKECVRFRPSFKSAFLMMS